MGEADEYNLEEAMKQYQLEQDKRKMTDEFRQMTLKPKFVERTAIDKKTKALTAKMNKLEIN